MTAAVAILAREYKQRDLAKWLSTVLGCSIRSGKRFSAHPELFPRSRAEQLLAALEAEEAAMEERRQRRREQLEAIRRELTENLGLDDPRLPLPRDRMAGGPVGDTVGRAGAGVPPPRNST